MDYSHKIGLRYQVLNGLGLEETDTQVDEILDLISKYVNVKDKDNDQLRTGIERILITKHSNSSKHEHVDQHPDLLYYIKPTYVQTIDQRIEWHTALQTALQPLIDDQKVNQSYYQELERQIKSPYNYSFLGIYIAIPHSTPHYGIKNDGIALLICKYPIQLTNNKMVRIIAPIAFFHMGYFLKAINQFADLAMDSHTIRELINSSDSKEAYEIIKDYVNEKNNDKS